MTTLDIRSPFDEHLVQSVAMTDEVEIRAMLKRAYGYYQDRNHWLQPHERMAILDRLFKQMSAEQEQLATLASEEGGKPLIDSKIEVARAIEGVALAKAHLMHLAGREIPMRLNVASEHRLAFTIREPLGVVLAISAFNHPVNLIIHQAITAIAAGCPVLIKPALQTPLSCLQLVQWLYEAGLPKAMCQVILCADHVAESLVADPRIAYVSFVGSRQVGWYLRTKLAPGTQCMLEHGGVASVIIQEDADWQAALPGLVKGGFYHAGQVCISVQRIWVHQKILKPFTKRLVELTEALKVGDPLRIETEVGPLINTKACERVDEWVQEAIYKGGKLLTGGQKVGKHGYQPTVILEPPANSLLATEEVFGPVVAISSFKDPAQAIEAMNAIGLPFQAAIYTTHVDRALAMARALEARSVIINDHCAFRVDWMPFGGLKQAGLGTGGIWETMEQLSYEKMLVIHSAAIA